MALPPPSPDPPPFPLTSRPKVEAKLHSIMLACEEQSRLAHVCDHDNTMTMM